MAQAGCGEGDATTQRRRIMSCPRPGGPYLPGAPRLPYGTITIMVARRLEEILTLPVIIGGAVLGLSAYVFVANG
jgi:hypothetical protein